MLDLAVSALKANEAAALREFNESRTSSSTTATFASLATAFPTATDRIEPGPDGPGRPHFKDKAIRWNKFLTWSAPAGRRRRHGGL